MHSLAACGVYVFLLHGNAVCLALLSSLFGEHRGSVSPSCAHVFLGHLALCGEESKTMSLSEHLLHPGRH